MKTQKALLASDVFARQRHELKIGHRGPFGLLRIGETFHTRNLGRYYSRRQVDQWLDVEVVGRLPLVETWSAFHNRPFIASQATKRTKKIERRREKKSL
jgi:hypothetical protein